MIAAPTGVNDLAPSHAATSPLRSRAEKDTSGGPLLTTVAAPDQGRMAQGHPRSHGGFGPKPGHHAPSVSAAKITNSLARHANYGTNRPAQLAPGTNRADSSMRTEKPYAGISSDWEVAAAGTTGMNVRDAEAPNMGPIAAHPHNQLTTRLHSRAQTPYHPDAWKYFVTLHNLIGLYARIPPSLSNGFLVRAPAIATTFTPPNHPSITLNYSAFRSVIEVEFTKGRYIGPFSQTALENLIGPFQSSPLSIIPKAGKPGKFRLIQNLSYPRNPTPRDSPAINTLVDSHLFPCAWGTFMTTCTLIASLPPGTQGATRDVAEAYRTIPLHPSQWPSLVVHIDDDPPTFAVDTALCFGYGPSAGVYGELRDAGLDIMCAQGMGPIIAWVDDHLFFRLPRTSIRAYNSWRTLTADVITQNGGRTHERCRIWFKGCELTDGTHEEFAEDCSRPLRDFPCPEKLAVDSDDAQYAYNFHNINSISYQLGIPWEASKDTPFSSKPVYLGFEWDLQQKTVCLTEHKRQKYTTAILQWLQSPCHPLSDVEKLYGKLSHAALVIPEGSAYLMSLQAMLGMFGDRPFMPRTQPCETTKDLDWWLHALENPTHLPIPHTPASLDLAAFSDACTSFGIAITVAGRWRAWRLLPGWDSDSRDIGWAESIGFEFLIRTLLILNSSTTPLTVYGDNQGVIEAWWAGRSRNKPTNTTFKQIHAALRSPPRRVFAKYVPSGHNPADGPSRGLYPTPHASLPWFPIPPDIKRFICNYNDTQYPPLGIQDQL